MNALLALGIGVLFGCGTWLLLRARTFDTVLGLTLLSYGVNLFLFASGRLVTGSPPIVVKAVKGAAAAAPVADPLPQALVLTAIVISFAMTALLLAIALRARDETGTDHVDGEEAPR